MGDNFSAQRIAGAHAESNKIHQAQQQAAASRYAIQQESQAEDFQEWSESLNPIAVAVRRFDSLESRVRRRAREQETERAEKTESETPLVDQLEEVSEQFHRKNPELQSQNLLLLRSRISNKDSADEILKKVLESYPDFSLADEALDFLVATTQGELQEKVQACKERFNETYGREIRAGKNIQLQAREFSTKGLGSPTGLRDLYREVTGNPRDALTLFNELSSQYPFEKMKTVIAFLLHSLGSDLKSKGPSIPRGELHRLTTETRSLQAILGVYRFFSSRMPLVRSSFERQGLATPSRITFELLAKLFVKFLLERYPSAEKVFQLGVQMGLSDELLAELIIYSQMRDAVRQVAPRLFRNDQHRQEVLATLIEALEEIEEKLEEEEDEEED
ncbi:MAG: YopN family type III secretion system gatekeeper subunit [Chlamydiae bacterium]|nr:YopN family type III secretion system gatekeeper subunit [Chlamydiota bacterium]